uniref:PHD-type domain-containing protein n=1 Tax=Macrostomum lignano TaxID=282301 RepID=A0A1I8FHU6_9PLAT
RTSWPIMYNDASVLENFHHCAVAFKLLQEPNSNIPCASWRDGQRKQSSARWSSTWTMVETRRVAGGCLLKLDNYSEKMQIMQEHGALRRPQATRQSPCRCPPSGSTRVMEEFFQPGGDREKGARPAGQPHVLPGKTQRGEVAGCPFIDFIVHPLWEAWTRPSWCTGCLQLRLFSCFRFSSCAEQRLNLRASHCENPQPESESQIPAMPASRCSCCSSACCQPLSPPSACTKGRMVPNWRIAAQPEWRRLLRPGLPRCESWDRCRFELERKSVLAKVNEQRQAEAGQPAGLCAGSALWSGKCVEDLEGSHEMSFFCAAAARQPDGLCGCRRQHPPARPARLRGDIGRRVALLRMQRQWHYVNCASQDDLRDDDGCQDEAGARVALGAAYKRTLQLNGRSVSLEWRVHQVRSGDRLRAAGVTAGGRARKSQRKQRCKKWLTKSRKKASANLGADEDDSVLSSPSARAQLPECSAPECSAPRVLSSRAPECSAPRVLRAPPSAQLPECSVLSSPSAQLPSAQLPECSAPECQLLECSAPECSIQSSARRVRPRKSSVSACPHLKLTVAPLAALKISTCSKLKSKSETMRHFWGTQGGAGDEALAGRLGDRKLEIRASPQCLSSLSCSLPDKSPARSLSIVPQSPGFIPGPSPAGSRPTLDMAGRNAANRRSINQLSAQLTLSRIQLPDEAASEASFSIPSSAAWAGRKFSSGIRTRSLSKRPSSGMERGNSTVLKNGGVAANSTSRLSPSSCSTAKAAAMASSNSWSSSDSSVDSPSEIENLANFCPDTGSHKQPAKCGLPLRD